MTLAGRARARRAGARALSGALPGALLGASLCALAGACADERPGRPNVVLIVVDTLRGDAILDPEGRIETPAIDALAAAGASFEQAFAHAPITSPSHTALFTSRPPFETGVMNNGQDVAGEQRVLAEHLGDHGYETRAVVSMGTVFVGNSSAMQGFDEYDHDFWRMSSGPATAERLERAVGQLAGEEPFFLFAHFSDPHEPYNAHGLVSREADLFLDGERIDTVSTSEMTVWEREVELAPGRHLLEVRSQDQFLVRSFELVPDVGAEPTWELGTRLRPTDFARIAFDHGSGAPRAVRLKLWINDHLTRAERIRRYAREVAFVDRYVGRLLDALRHHGLYDGSLIVFTSDHGEELGEHGHVGHIQSVHDEQLHVPLLIKPPAGDARLAALRERAGGLVPLQDVAPTILELVGLPPLPGQRGASILAPRREPLLIAQTHAPQARRNLICLRDERFKLVYDVDQDRFRMYDLARDPLERRDVFDVQGAAKEEWVERLRAIAEIAAQGGLDLGTVDAETRRRLESLGY